MTWEPRPLPNVTPETDEFWRRATDGELVITHCGECDETFHYPRTICPNCFSNDVTLESASGDGTLYSYTVTQRVEGWPDEHLPLILAYVELEEGPRIMTNLVGCPPEQVTVEMPVEAMFVKTDTETIGIPVFTPK